MPAPTSNHKYARWPAPTPANGGFTLAELLIVLVILALVVGVVYPAVHGISDRIEARRAAAEARQEEHQRRFRAFVSDQPGVPLLEPPARPGKEDADDH